MGHAVQQAPGSPEPGAIPGEAAGDGDANWQDLVDATQELTTVHQQPGTEHEDCLQILGEPLFRNVATGVMRLGSRGDVRERGPQSAAGELDHGDGGRTTEVVCLRIGLLQFGQRAATSQFPPDS